MSLTAVIAVCVLACIGIERSTEVYLQQQYRGIKRPRLVVWTALSSVSFCAPAIYMSIAHGLLVMFVQALLQNTSDLRWDPMMYIFAGVLAGSFVATGYSLFQLGRPVVALVHRPHYR